MQSSIYHSSTSRPLPKKSHVVAESIEPSFLEKGLGLSLDLIEASLPPVYRLPHELLSHIFQFDDLDGVTLPTPFAWAIAHVCREWRGAAFGTASLWSTIMLDVSPPRISTKRLDGLLEMLDVCLELSKAVPIDFAIFLRHKNTTSNAVLGRLCKHVHRWRKVVVIASTDALIPWQHQIQDRTPLLESLSVGNLDGEAGTVDISRVFYGSTLSTLQLCYHQMDGPLASISTPWTQIRCLRLSACAYSILPSVLKQLPNLKSLEIEGVPPRAGIAYSGSPITLPTLEILHITAYIHHIANVLPFIHTSSLAQLTMKLYTNKIDSPQTTIVQRTPKQVVHDFISRTKAKKTIVEYFDTCYYLDSVQDHISRFIR